MRSSPPRTPDGRYIVVRERLWRATNPNLSEAEAAKYRKQLGQARSAIRVAKQTGDRETEKAARQRVHAAKLALGERGEPWWTDGQPDYNRHLIKNTPYHDWWVERMVSDD
jgi:hypothetical protein